MTTGAFDWVQSGGLIASHGGTGIDQLGNVTYKSSNNANLTKNSLF
jgi:hypothetical protein